TSSLTFSFSDSNGTGSGDGNANAAMTFRGTISGINAALTGLIYTPDPDYNGTDELHIHTNDLGNTGSGGALTDEDTVAITVNAVNDVPVNSVPGAQTTNEDTALIFSTANGNLMSIADVDAGSSNVQLTL